MGIAEFEEVGREFAITLNFLTDDKIAQETYDCLIGQSSITNTCYL